MDHYQRAPGQCNQHKLSINYKIGFRYFLLDKNCWRKLEEIMLLQQKMDLVQGFFKRLPYQSHTKNRERKDEWLFMPTNNSPSHLTYLCFGLLGTCGWARALCPAAHPSVGS